MTLKNENRLLYVAFITVLLTLASSVYKIYKLKHEFTTPAYDDSIIRIYRPVPGGGMIFCSGTVVSRVHIITAAHCLAPTIFDVEAPTLEIRTSTNVPLGVYAHVEAYDANSDLAILFGDFSRFQYRDVISGAEEINRIFKENSVAICGYPMGGRITCSKLTEPANANFKLSAMGFAYPGMSGGPVIDLTTGNIIGVTTAVDDDRVILSPTVEIWQELHVSENQ